MAIVASGVHHAGRLRPPRYIRSFLDGEGIHIRPKKDGLATPADADYTPGMIARVQILEARHSELLERAAGGEEVVIPSAGPPQAELVGLGATAPPPFRVTRALLRRRPKAAPRAEALVREERDARE